MSLVTSRPLDESADLWCRRCPAPATEMVGDHAYCHEHALDALWKANSPSWNPKPAKQRVVRLDDLSPAQRQLVKALIDAKKETK